MAGGRPRLYTSNEQMEKDIDNYFDTCDKEQRPYTMSGLALALHMDRKSLINYSNREEFFHTIKNARQKVEQQLEEHLYRIGNNSGIIFNLKNNFSWKDTVEVKTEEETSKLDELIEALKDVKKD